MNRTCKKCGVEKSLDEFQKNKNCLHSRTHTCKACFTLYQKQWNDEHPGYAKAYRKQYYQDRRSAFRVKSRRQHLEREYDITPEQYEAMHKAQNGVCAICGGTNAKTGKLLDVDHDHTTGVVRGLLCNSCNMALGRIGDSTDTLRKAIAYLERFQTKDATG